jgi:hypothetical protein
MRRRPDVRAPPSGGESTSTTTPNTEEFDMVHDDPYLLLALHHDHLAALRAEVAADRLARSVRTPGRRGRPRGFGWRRRPRDLASLTS